MNEYVMSRYNAKSYFSTTSSHCDHCVVNDNHLNDIPGILAMKITSRGPMVLRGVWRDTTAVMDDHWTRGRGGHPLTDLREGGMNDTTQENSPAAHLDRRVVQLGNRVAHHHDNRLVPHGSKAVHQDQVVHRGRTGTEMTVVDQPPRNETVLTGESWFLKLYWPVSTDS